MKKPLRPNRKLLAIWRRMTAEQKRVFAGHAGSSVDSLRQYADGRRPITTEIAVRMENAARAVTWARVDRTDLSPVCAKCEYAKAVRQVKARDLV